MQATCSCHTRLCRRHRQTGSSNRRARSTLQSRWASVLSHTMMQMSPRATVPGYRQSRRPRSPASRNRTGHLPFANRAGCKRARARFGRAWVVRAGRAGRMGLTCDARKEIAFPSHQGGAGRAHVEGEWLGRMFRAGRHAGYMPWSSEERGPSPGRHTWPGAPSRTIEIGPNLGSGKKG